MGRAFEFSSFFRSPTRNPSYERISKNSHFFRANFAGRLHYQDGKQTVASFTTHFLLCFRLLLFFTCLKRHSIVTVLSPSFFPSTSVFCQSLEFNVPILIRSQVQKTTIHAVVQPTFPSENAQSYRAQDCSTDLFPNHNFSHVLSRSNAS